MVGLKQLPGLLGNRSEQLVRRRSARHQRGHPPQRGLLIGKLTQPRLAGCIMALRRVYGMAHVGAGIGRIHKADGSPVPGGPLGRVS